MVNSEPDFRTWNAGSSSISCWCDGSRTLSQLRLMGHDEKCVAARRGEYLNRLEAAEREAQRKEQVRHARRYQTIRSNPWKFVEEIRKTCSTIPNAWGRECDDCVDMIHKERTGEASESGSGS